MARRWTHLIVHHTAGRMDETVDDIRALHVNVNKWNDIGYHYLVQWDIAGKGGTKGKGYLKQGRPDTKSGAHAGVTKWNNCAIGLCIIGYFHPGTQISVKLTEAQYQDVLAACVRLCRKYGIPAEHVLGHRDVKHTACPGDWFPLAILKADVKEALTAARQVK